MDVSGSGTAAPPRPTPSSAARVSRTRPSSRPARLMIGASAVAALTVITAGLVRFPTAADDQAAIVPEPENRRSAVKAGTRANVGPGATAKTKAKSKRPVKYVRLKPGQKAPKGAKVIKEPAPTPRIVVRQVGNAPRTATAPQAAMTPQQRNSRVVTRTKQSG